MYIYHKQCNVKSYYVTSESHCANDFHRNLKQDLTFKHVINAIFIDHNDNHKLLAVQGQQELSTRLWVNTYISRNLPEQYLVWLGIAP